MELQPVLYSDLNPMQREIYNFQKVAAILNQSQGGMCICRVPGIGAGVSRECFGP